MCSRELIANQKAMRRRYSLPAFLACSFLLSRAVAHASNVPPFGLSSAWLNAAEVRRLNGFQCRCPRVILGVKAAFFSRVSNAAVLSQAGQVQLGKQLLKQQLLLYGKVVRAPKHDPVRSLTFIPGGREPATCKYIRKVGRPRNEWAAMLGKECSKMSVQMGVNIGQIIHIVRDWRAAVHEYIT